MDDAHPTSITDLGRILAVFAHPDDEAYLAGGLLAAAVDAGQPVTVITATYGEAGFGDPVAWPPERAAWVRWCEASAAMGVLGVRDHRVLGFPDGGCADVDRRHASARLAALVDEIDPDTLVTFGPDGMTGHADHIAVHGWVTEAVEHYVDRRPRVLHATAEEGWAERFADLHRRLPIYEHPSLPTTVPSHELDLHLELAGPALDRKLVALRAYATQTAPVIAAFGDDAYRAWVSEEGFVEVVAARPRPATPSPAEPSEPSEPSEPGQVGAAGEVVERGTV